MWLYTLLSILAFCSIDTKLQENNPFLRNNNYITSTIHAFITYTVSFYYLLDKISTQSYLELNCISVGYAIYDIYHLYITNSPSRNFLIIHHLMIVFVNIWVNFNIDLFVLKMMAFNYLTEFTTPFLNISLYLYQTKQTQLKYYGFNLFKTCNFLLITSFLFLRIFLGIYLVKVNLFYNYLSYLQVVMLGMNSYWFSKLVKKAIKII